MTEHERDQTRDVLSDRNRLVIDGNLSVPDGTLECKKVEGITIIFSPPYYIPGYDKHKYESIEFTNWVPITEDDTNWLNEIMRLYSW